VKYTINDKVVLSRPPEGPWRESGRLSAGGASYNCSDAHSLCACLGKGSGVTAIYKTRRRLEVAANTAANVPAFQR
jgi:hypothetical protein